MRALVSAAVSGLLFGIGLALSGMLNPAKVIGFLDFAGNWDPSLAFVMGGGVAVAAIAFPFVLKRPQPVCEASFQMPTQKDVDPALIIGGGIFGVGWGMAGLCPGPAFSSLSFLRWESMVLFAAMIAGMVIFRFTRKISGLQIQRLVEDG
ncbi:MAG: hypothetical protein CMM60_08550 [Rhodospirillaceae bacterium]|jgi:hypothetical protein|nr:hypothetical protein [Rhodospirillaceae bacterium]|tara:strand:- start:373 stop:822 length:450 start_codon:yes stop_codon:yes gene_type:complete